MLLLLVACESPPAVEPQVVAPTLFPSGLPTADVGDVPGLATLSAQTCAACHHDAHDTWEGSAHATAWASPTYRAAVAAAGNSTACLGCHLPLKSQHEQLADGYLDGDITRPRLVANPGFDATLQSEGVTCVVCHVRDGKVLSANEPKPAPHPTVQSDELVGSALCATCHQLSWPGADKPFYDTWGEWDRAGFSTAGVECRVCHMGPENGSPSHALRPDPRRALTTLVALASTTVGPGQTVDVGVSLLNSGAGHSVPTGSPYTRWEIDVALVDGNGSAVATAPVQILERVVEAVPPWSTTSDTRLGVGERRDVHAQLVVPASYTGGAIDVRLKVGGATWVLRHIPVTS